MIELTDAAREKILGALQAASPPRRHLRIESLAEGVRWDYRLAGLTDEEVRPDDIVQDEGDFAVVLDPASAERLSGATVDYRESLLESGFRIDNPNAPASPVLASGERPDLEGPVPDRIRLLLDSEINPAIATHGGHVRLVEVRGDRAYVAFGGGCHGCGLVDVTLKQGVEARIREVVPEIAEVVDTTDHAAGTDPYY